MAIVVEAANIGSTPTEMVGRERGRGDESRVYMYIYLSTFAVHKGHQKKQFTHTGQNVVQGFTRAACSYL